MLCTMSSMTTSIPIPIPIRSIASIAVSVMSSYSGCSRVGTFNGNHCRCVCTLCIFQIAISTAISIKISISFDAVKSRGVGAVRTLHWTICLLPHELVIWLCPLTPCGGLQSADRSHPFTRGRNRRMHRSRTAMRSRPSPRRVSRFMSPSPSPVPHRMCRGTILWRLR